MGQIFRVWWEAVSIIYLKFSEQAIVFDVAKLWHMIYLAKILTSLFK
jgi:hypothetical protein